MTSKQPARAPSRSYKLDNTRYDYDVIVIGTGMGGCAAGAISALHGMKTLILEKNPKPGGNCSYYEKQGFYVDAGTHLFSGGNTGPFGVLTKRLGMGTPIPFVNPEWTVHAMGWGMDVTLPSSKIRMLTEFVLPKAAIQSRISPRHYPGILRLARDIMRMKPHEIEQLDEVSVYDFLLRYTSNPDIRSMIALFLGMCFIVPPWEATAGEAIWNVQNAFNDISWYPKGGGVVIPRTFLSGAENHGAVVRLDAEVKKIEISDGRASAVVLSNGERFTTKAVISTTGIKDTVLRLTGEEYYPAEYARRIKSLKSSWSAIQAKIGIGKKVEKAGMLVGNFPLKKKVTDESLMKTMSQLENGEMLDTIAVYASIPSNFDPDLAPEGCQFITAVGVAPTLDVDLKVTREQWHEGLMDALYHMLPGLKENIIFCDAWSVPVLAGYLGKDNGAAITTGQTIDQVGYRRPPSQTPVRGLYVAGDCAGPARGIGTALACQSGMDCADNVCSQIYNYVI